MTVPDDKPQEKAASLPLKVRGKPLSPVRLQAIAQVTDETLRQAVENWKADPPDERWAGVMEAEVQE